MIRINKSDTIPIKLSGIGAYEKVLDMCHFLCDPNPFVNTDKGAEKKKFKNEIYGHHTVKEQLKKEQYEKCCYCESKFTANSPGDVEHFRPKTAFNLPGISGYFKPGYYWLAYDWENLFFSCEVCNREYKKNFFHLLDEDERASSHLKNSVDSEQPVLISPLEDPTNHIKFEEDTIIGKDFRGKESIEYYGLKRTELLDARLASFKNLKNIGPLKGDTSRVTPDFLDAMNQSPGEIYTVDDLVKIITENNDFIADSISDKGEFSLMARTSFG